MFSVVSCVFYSSLCFSLFFEVDSQEPQSGAREVQFTVTVKDSVQRLCCLYKGQDGRYSAFSPYLWLESTRGVSMF